ncbi:MAG: PD-(D/E)XK nuclease family protein [Deltaproteobacteria bacterium]|nr:MAG: PD-(D/E)XK nuclease family protein [Deltaproteobacteria bacterium]
MASTRALAHAPWSSSKIQTALRCPREFHYRYVDRVPESDASPEARIGKAVHGVLERALVGDSVDAAVAEGRRLMHNDAERRRYDALAAGVGAFIDRVAAFRRRHRVTRQFVEFTLAVREDLSLTQFHASDALYRGIFDAGYLYDDGKLAVVDHKCGERRTSLAFSDQLEGYAVLAAAMFRNVRAYWLGVHWVAECQVDWSGPVTPQQVADELAPRMLANIEAAALAVDDGPRPAPSDWCLLCSYRSICPAAHDLLLEPVDDEPPPDWEL